MLKRHPSSSLLYSLAGSNQSWRAVCLQRFKKCVLRTAWGGTELGTCWNCVCDDDVLSAQLPPDILFSSREMVAPRSSTWAVPRRISSTKGKSTDSRRGDPICLQLHLLSGWREGLGTPLDFTIIEKQLITFSKAV